MLNIQQNLKKKKKRENKAISSPICNLIIGVWNLYLLKTLYLLKKAYY